MYFLNFYINGMFFWNLYYYLILRVSFLNIDKLISGLPWWLSGKNPPANAGDAGSIRGSGRSPGEGNGNPLQYSCLRIPQTEEPGELQSMELQRVGYD